MCRRCVLAPPSKWLPSRGSLLRTLCVITDSEKTSGNKTSGWRFQVASSLCHIQQCRRIVSSWSSLWPSSAAAPVKVKKKKKKIREQVVALLFPPLSVSETQSCYLSRPTNVTAKWREKEGEKMDKSWVDTLLNQPQSGDEAWKSQSWSSRATTHTQGGGLDDIWMGGGRQIYFPKNVVVRVN